MSLERLRRLASALGMRLDVIPRWRGAEVDRLLNAGHAALHEAVARMFLTLPDWQVTLEVSFSVFGERGVIDILAWHQTTGCLLLIGLKTQLVDPQELVASRSWWPAWTVGHGWPRPSSVTAAGARHRFHRGW